MAGTSPNGALLCVINALSEWMSISPHRRPDRASRIELAGLDDPCDSKFSRRRRLRENSAPV
jgi:hypothetical protein